MASLHVVVVQNIVRRPLVGLTVVFILWKCLLLLLASLAPGVGYDTSTDLLLREGNVDDTDQLLLYQKLARWDAIYFVQLAKRGHVFEQEWAFGIGLSSILRYFSQANLTSIMCSGVILSHFSHYFSVVFLWQSCKLVVPSSRSIPLLAAVLLILSPAGVFLSAPYTESPFACLSMMGYWLYIESHNRRRPKYLTPILKLMSGSVFACATVIRSNGVFSGLLFLYDCTEFAFRLRASRASLSGLGDILATVSSGLIIAVGFAIPQTVAYTEYCQGKSPSRPWCSNRIPLIYSFVQSHYWNVGFLRYWTLSNVPLFLLASPCLILLLYSSWDTLRNEHEGVDMQIARRLVLPQLVLASLAVTQYHVQIITRLSSAYPWAHIWLAINLGRLQWTSVAVRVFAMYALIQTGLFSEFLPPA